ncbi:two-component system response regulator MprA [Kitasatospora sp. SolWspMP-SS2h]|uniref:response regulator transcription factor n=1 Tax=Kitasatospora sp. SolWspMP-SS2h TaxID=1305729 RepID=UPI000DBA2513|nr:response regulator transcription factor [Kitasatospora sp. SolWspMP-SS2h]RAJ36789.1 two-component system response regulator MprA [Kitasatospora sp. SolWspMP-SS2h]
MTAHRILVVEDDAGLRGILARGLREERFEVLTAVDGAEALRLAGPDVDAVVLDIGLPDSDGRDVCQALRSRGVQTPVVFLTAYDGLVNRLSGFAAGGDDYLAKPFHVAELAARLRAVLRRAGADAALEAAGVRLDPVRLTVQGPAGQVALTPTEFRLLGCLLAAGAGSVVRRQGLARAGWPEGAIVSDNTLDQYVARLRRKLRRTGADTTLTTARGVGYRLS